MNNNILVHVLRMVKAKDPRDQPFVELQAKELLAKGWRHWDVTSYLSCMEEVNPEMPEDRALAKMRRIRAKYEPGYKTLPADDYDGPEPDINNELPNSPKK